MTGDVTNPDAGPHGREVRFDRHATESRRATAVVVALLTETLGVP